MSSDDNAPAHQLVTELLSRYAEAVQAGLEVKRMYPLMYRHLAACEVCRGTLSYLLLSPDAPGPAGGTVASPGRPSSLPAAHEVEGGRPSRLAWAWRPGSHPGSFGLHLSLSVRHHLGKGPFSARLPTRRGKLLTFRWPQANAGVLQMQLTLEGTRPGGCVAIAGRLTGLTLPAGLRATLFAGYDVYDADVRGNELRFNDVALGAEVERVALVVETP